jgi:protein CpxP
MKTIVTALLTSTLLIGAAYAQQPPTHASEVAPAPDAPQAMKSAAERNADVQRHIENLHAKLGITPSEESLWSAVARTMADNANSLDAAIDKRDHANTSAIDDLNAYADVVQAHADGVKKLSAVFSPLYASMSGDQKVVADEVFAKREHPGKNDPQAMK